MQPGVLVPDELCSPGIEGSCFVFSFFFCCLEEEERERVLLCLGGGLVFLTLRDLDTDLCLLSLFFGEAGVVLLLVIGLCEGVLLLGGDLGVLESFQGISPLCSVQSHCWRWSKRRKILLSLYPSHP